MRAIADRGRPGFFRVIRFDRTLRGSGQAVRYVAFRSRDLIGRERRVFDATHDQADVKRFERSLDDPITEHRRVAKAYHTVFSLRRKDFDRAEMQSWRDTVRSVMRTYEHQTGRKLEWIASEHLTESHPHCHVVIKAAYTTRHGVKRRLRLDRREIQRIKEIADDVLKSRGLGRGPEHDRSQDPSRQMTAERGLTLASGILGWLQKQIAADRSRRLREDDEMRRRQLRRESRDER